MLKSRLTLFCTIVFALAGTRTAKAQDGAGSLDDQIQNKYSEREPDKAATAHQKDKTQAKNDDGHRKHWWSMPHFRHKKKDENSASQLKTQPKHNPVTPSSQAMSKPAAHKQVASQKHVAKTSAPRERSNHKTLTAAKPSHKTIAKNKTSTNPSGKAHKGAVATSGHAKDVRQNCSSAVTKKGGCQSVQKHTKPATRAS
jgi:hypothetical protein